MPLPLIYIIYSRPKRAGISFLLSLPLGSPPPAPTTPVEFIMQLPALYTCAQSVPGPTESAYSPEVPSTGHP